MTARRGLTHDAKEAAARALGVDVGARLDDAAAAAWSRLDAPRRAVIATLVGLGGAAPALVVVEEAAEELSTAEPAATTRRARPKPASVDARATADRALLALWEEGLVARDRTSRTFFLVPDVASALKAPVRDALVESLPPCEPAAPSVDEHALLCLAALVRHEPVRLTREGLPFKRGLEALAERLRPLLPRRDPLARVELLLATLRDSRMVRLSGEALELVPDEAIAWARLEGPRRAELVLDADDTGLARLVLRQIHAIGPDKAWPVDQLVRLVRRLVRRPADGDPAPAEDVERAIRLAIAALERAGLASVAEGRLALTADGRLFPKEGPRAPAPRGFHVGADLCVLVPRGLDAAAHLALSCLARMESADAVARYRLERDLILDALDVGWTPEAVEALLDGSTPPLPDSVRDDVRRWCARFGEVTSHQGVAVLCSVPERWGEFAAVVTRSGLAAELVAPGTAVVHPSDHASLRAALLASGFSPRRSVLAPGRVDPDEPAVTAERRDRATAPDATLWGESLAAGAALQSAPSPGALATQLKDKYRREFGSARLEALDGLEVDELIALEERGGIRQFLAEKSPGGPAVAARLDEYEADEMIPVSPLRARQVLEQAVLAGARCEVGHAQRPGHSVRLDVDPLEIVADRGGTWLRARTSAGHERLLAVDRIHALRVLKAPGGRGRKADERAP